LNKKIEISQNRLPKPNHYYLPKITIKTPKNSLSSLKLIIILQNSPTKKIAYLSQKQGDQILNSSKLFTICAKHVQNMVKTPKEYPRNSGEHSRNFGLCPQNFSFSFAPQPHYFYT